MPREPFTRIEIHGHHLPGREGHGSDGEKRNIHGGVQRGRVVEQLVPGDAQAATWQLAVERVPLGFGYDFRGPYVQGKRGERFLYISWGTVDDEGTFTMFRRAKLMLDDVPGDLWYAASRGSGVLSCALSLRDAEGNPICARLRADALKWTAS